MKYLIILIVSLLLSVDVKAQNNASDSLHMALDKISDINLRLERFKGTHTGGVAMFLGGAGMTTVGILSGNDIFTYAGAAVGVVGSFTMMFAPFSLRYNYKRKQY